MPFQIQDGTGSVHLAQVDNTGALLITGSVNTSLNVATGSESYNFVSSGTGWISEPQFRPVVISGTPGVIGSVTVTTNPVPISGGIIVRAGSIQPYNPIGVGSVRIAEQGLNLQVYNSGLFSVVGSITSVPLTQVYNSGAFSIVGSLTSIPGMGSFAITTSPLPVSGTNIGGSASVIVAGSVQTYSPLGVGSVYQIASQRTYPTFEIIRKSAGSPATNFVLAGISRSIMIDVLGSNSVYFNFNADANPANSGTAFLYAGNTISLDIEIGSISIQSSGTTNTEVQVIGIR